MVVRKPNHSKSEFLNVRISECLVFEPPLYLVKLPQSPFEVKRSRLDRSDNIAASTIFTGMMVMYSSDWSRDLIT